MRLTHIFVAISACAFTAFAAAQALAANEEPVIEWEKRQNSDERLRSFGPDLLGDLIDPASGSITFEHVDVSLPGNNGLDVSLRRRLVQGPTYKENKGAVDVEFGNWHYVAPRITVVARTSGWGDSSGRRCTVPYNTSLPPIPAGKFRQLYNQDYSNGVSLELPGAGSQPILEAPAAGRFPIGATHGTAENWWFTCIANIGSTNGGGEGFIGHAPNGDIYRFDRHILIPYTSLGSLSSGKGSLFRGFSILAATSVTDVNGNTVNYTYDASGRLTRILASDGREIQLIYGNASYPSLVTQVKANPNNPAATRTWTYSYRPTNYRGDPWDLVFPATNQVLGGVTLPDGTSWTLNLDAMAAGVGPDICFNDDQTISLTHPNGVTGTFYLSEIRHRMGLNSMTQEVLECPTNEPPPPGSPPPPVFHSGLIDTMSVISKTLSGPGISPAQWSYQYEYDPGPSGTSASDPTNWTLVTEPGGSKIKYHHVWQDYSLGTNVSGQLLKKEIFSGGAATPIETFVQTQGAIANCSAGLPLTSPNLQGYRPYDVTITRDGSTYRTVSAYNIDCASPTYSYGFPISVTETSSTTPETRTTDNVYAHNKTKWILGLPSSITRNGKLFDTITYDANGRLLTKSTFGTLKQTFTYNLDGTVATYKDAHNHVWTLSNWKRGKPQLVVRPSDASTPASQFSRVVDDNGWVTSETDYRGSVFGFTYNGMGWLTGVDYPAPFNDVSVAYSNLATGVIETRTRGAKKTTISYDGMLRPKQVKTEATDGSATTSYVETAYDIFGKPTFQSWPAGAAGSLAGVATTYDALGRTLTVAETVAPYATTTTQYLSGGEVRVTDPVNAVVRTFNRAFGNPDEAEPMSVIDAMGATTTMTRDIYGNVLTLAQSGTQNGISASVTRNFWYDNELRLCRHRAPEFGDEIFFYDSANLLTDSARGVAAANGCATSVPASLQVHHHYDAVHRELAVGFPEPTPDIWRTFDANGNVTSISRGATVWNYTYTALDAILTEQLAIDGRTYTIGHSYNANGDVTARSNSHSGVTVDFNANAYGQLRRASIGSAAYIFNGLYHPNGTMKSADIGGGYPGAAQALSQTINNRNLISELKVAKAGGATAVWLTPQYDERRKLSSIADLDGAGDDESRSFTYDPNGRLLTANGPWGTGSYVYDALGNIRNRTEGSNSVSIINYNPATNRVSTATISGQNRTFSYDARGNTTNNGKYSFVYDFANQPVSQTGTVSATFAYDGNLKRVKEVRGGKTIYTVYSRVTGGLAYRDEATDGIVTDYVSVGAAAVRLKKTGTGPVVPEYTHFDLQGSAVAATDDAGVVTWRESYRPYGRTRLDAPANDNNTGYTGHLEDSSTGLVYMQARYYDPLIGRFYSTDPIGYEDQLNLYAYVANDPVNATDPTGEFGLIGAGFGAVIGGGVAAYKNFKATGNAFSDKGAIAKGAIVGGALGFVGGAGAQFIKAGITGSLAVGAAEVAVTDTAAKGALVLVGAELNASAVIAANGIEASQNPDANFANEAVSESILKTAGDIAGPAVGLPPLGGAAVGLKDAVESALSGASAEESKIPDLPRQDDINFEFVGGGR